MKGLKSKYTLKNRTTKICINHTLWYVIIFFTKKCRLCHIWQLKEVRLGRYSFDLSLGLQSL